MKCEILLAAVATFAAAGSACKNLEGIVQRPGEERTSEREEPSSQEGRHHDESGGDDRADRRADERMRTVERVVTIDPAPGVARMKAQRPGWCDGIPREELKDAMPWFVSMHMTTIKREGRWWGESREVLIGLCASPDDGKVQEQTGHFLQVWANESGMTPAQLNPFFTAFARGGDRGPDRYKLAVENACKKFPAASDEAAPRDKLFSEVVRASLACNADGTPYWTGRGNTPTMGALQWEYDAFADPPSELIRSYVVLACLEDRPDIEESQLLAYALCGVDARALTSARLEKEIAGFPPLSRIFARQQHMAARRLAARYEELARARSKGDPAWKAILFDAPEGAWREWKELYAGAKAVIDAARAYEEVFRGPSKAAARGCWPEAWGNFKAQLAGTKVRSVAEAKRAMTGPVTGILLEHVTACARAEENMMADPALRLLEAARPVRGPRVAIRFAVIDALNEITRDRSKFAVKPDSLGEAFSGRSPLAGGTAPLESLDLSSDDKGGVVQSVKPAEGGYALVVFKSDRWQEDAFECADTNQIDRIDSDGKVVYRHKCVAAGKRLIDDTHPPALVPRSLVDALKPGRFARLLSADRVWYKQAPQPPKAVPIEVWDTKERKKLLMYMGVPLAAN